MALRRVCTDLCFSGLCWITRRRRRNAGFLPTPGFVGCTVRGKLLRRGAQQAALRTCRLTHVRLCAGFSSPLAGRHNTRHDKASISHRIGIEMIPTQGGPGALLNCKLVRAHSRMDGGSTAFRISFFV